MVTKKKKAKKKTRKLKPEEKEEKAREGELPSKKIRTTESKQIMWFLIVIGIIFIAFLGTYYGVVSQRHFIFEGAEWWIEGEREGWGDLTLYHGRYPIKTASGKLITNMNLWLYNDPRDNNVPADINFTEDGIAKNVIITFDSSLTGCSDKAVVIPQLSQAFGTGLPWTSTVGAIANSTRAQELGLPHADCGNVSSQNSVILIREGNTSRVYSKEGCYVIEYSECSHAVKSSEKLILELIRQLND